MAQQETMPAFHTPVLLIAFNRPGPARRVMEAIRAARPPRLYFACDGARNEGERARCEEVRALTSMVDWPCELHTLFSDVNLGVRLGESKAMSWFFDHEEEGIVLEDDTLPQASFFPYCEELLERYRDDERVWCIMGNNLMADEPLASGDSYYFSAHGYGAYWGWAGWRRVWRHYDVEMRDWPAVRDSGILLGHFFSHAEAKEAYKLFHHTHEGNIRSWDYQFDLGRILNHAMAVIPAMNLIRNIGFGPDGTHTVSELDPRNKETAGEMDFPMRHPRHMLVDMERDQQYFFTYIRPKLYRRFKNKVKDMLPPAVDQALTPVLSRLQRKLGIG